MSPKRITCAACLRPQQTCICRWAAAVASDVEVLILQHPLEVANVKNSARLLHLSLPNSRLAVGECFAQDRLEALLAGPRQSVLLYPEIPPGSAPAAAVAPPFEPAPGQQAPALRLVVLDGTWRKSRKMLHLNPGLQRLPRLPLRDLPASRYLIRKAHAPDQLSTLEATCYALAQLENDPEKFAPLIAAFDGFIGQQQGCRLAGQGAQNSPPNG